MFKKYTYIISLLLLACTKEQVVPVVAEFNIEVVNDDYSIPVEIVIFNKSKEADTYQWTFEGGIPAASTSRNPGGIAAVKIIEVKY